MENTPITIDEMAAFCKRKGIVYPNSEIYGSYAGFWDYGPYGVELANNVKKAWWKFHVNNRDDVFGIDGSIIAHPKVWQASGHVGCFADQMLTCKECKEKQRADVYIEEKLEMAADGISAEEVNEIVKKHELKCPHCGGEFKEVNDFNLMFQTYVGPQQNDEAIAYLRPETAQLIFTNFKLVYENARAKLPFGIAQIGKAFRNEISPRNFLFRCREFEQMEMEYFIHPDKSNECPYIDEVMDYSLNVLTAEAQDNNEEAVPMTVKEALENNVIKTQWHAYWLAQETQFFVSHGAKKENFRVRQHLLREKSHYALETWDLEYKFPFGFKELQGVANRTDYDLKQHAEHSGKSFEIFDEETKTKIVPHVVCEPAQGVSRALLVFLFDAYHDDKERGNVVLHLHPSLASTKVAILPLMKKPELVKVARDLQKDLQESFVVSYDQSGSIGKRYARNDEIGTPYCVTIDFDSLEDKSVTVRDRDSTKQARVLISEVESVVRDLMRGRKKFEELSLIENGA